MDDSMLILAKKNKNKLISWYMQIMLWDEMLQQIKPGSWSPQKKNRSSSQARAKRAVLLLIFFKAAPVFGRFGR